MHLNRRIIFILGCIIVVVLYFAIFGEKGLNSSLQMMKEYREIELNIERMRVKNTQLKEEISLIQNETFYVEKKAREELGLARDDEIIYEFNE